MDGTNTASGTNPAVPFSRARGYDGLRGVEGMYHYKDPAGPTRAAVVALSLYMVLDLVSASLMLAFPPDPVELTPLDLVPALDFVALLACFVLVGRWIYRVVANAHAVGEAVSITPGWAVGWYFVPLANLVMPYQAMRETWDASHEAAALEEGRDTALLPCWWGLWLVTNIVSNVAAWSGGLGEPPTGLALTANLVAALLNVPLCLILIRIARRLLRVQRLAANRDVFA